MIQTIKKAWGIPELRKKIVFTALILLIFRIGNAIPVPWVDTKLLSDYLSSMSTTVLGLYLSLIHISEPTRLWYPSRMPASA